MSRVVYKYDLMIGCNLLMLPEGSKVLHVGEQYTTLCMWVEHDPSAPVAQKRFDVHGTGHYIIDDDAFHIATVQMTSGLVWHIYGSP